MERIEILTEIAASPGDCFDLSRDLDLHQRTMAHSGEQAVAGKTAGLLGLNEEVTWRARHFGVVHLHQARITLFTRPTHFRDEMVHGRFKSFVHDHFFEPSATGTLMRDVLEFASPLGLLGRLVDRLVLRRYLEALLIQRNAQLKREAERGHNGVARTKSLTDLAGRISFRDDFDHKAERKVGRGDR